MGRLANYMKQQNSRETQARGMRELEAINGEKGMIYDDFFEYLVVNAILSMRKDS